MAWTDLPTNYTDATWEGNRKYNLIANDDETVSLEDVTKYSNDARADFRAADINRTNAAINELGENRDAFYFIGQAVTGSGKVMTFSGVPSGTSGRKRYLLLGSANHFPAAIMLVQSSANNFLYSYLSGTYYDQNGNELGSTSLKLTITYDESTGNLAITNNTPWSRFALYWLK